MAAALDWPNCPTAADGSGAVCAQWTDGDLEFRLLALRGENGPVPVISSSMIGHESSDKIVIHLSGGPDDDPLSFIEDKRLGALRYFYNNNFRIISIGYWGTNFRTLNERNEIRLASQDLVDTYTYLSNDCSCKPVIVAESLGAGVLFHMMRTQNGVYEYVAISPVLAGLRSAVKYFGSSLSETDLAVGAKLSNVYERDADGQPILKHSRLINTFDHISRFSADEDSDYKEEFSTPCSTVVVGSADPLNQEISEPHSSRIVVVEGAGHDLYKDAPGRLSSVIEDFIRCVEK